MEEKIKRIKASEILSEDEIKKLPGWVKADIDNDFLIGYSQTSI